MAQLKDIAEMAGVSTAAVSRVLNNRMGNVGIKAEKQKRIREIASRLNYVPSHRARSMAKQKAYALGVLCTSIAQTSDCYEKAAVESYFYGTLSGVENICQEHGYNCIFSVCEEKNFEKFVYPKNFKDGSVDGIVLVGYTQPHIFKKLQDFKIPFVHIGSNYDSDLQINTVSADLVGAFAEVIEYYKSLNHKKVNIVLPGGPGPMKIRESLQQKMKRRCGIEVEFTIADILDPGQDYYYDCGKRLGVADDPATGIILSSYKWDSFVKGLLASGKSCPDDYSLFVTTSSFVYAEGVPFPVSSIVLPQREIGVQAARRLFSELDAQRLGEERGAEVVPCEIRVGKTCSRFM